MSNLRSLGAEAEDRAAEYLLGLGYTLVARRVKLRGGEVDLVALDGASVVFVEVKKRLALGWSPEEAIDPKKIKRLFQAAEDFLHRLEITEHKARFDVIAIDQNGMRHYPDAFRL